MEKENRKSVAGNVTYHLLFRLVMTLSPLIVAPHLARELGASNLGIFSFALANAEYFILFARMGIDQHGTRTLAENINDKDRFSQIFWDLYAVQFLMSLMCIALYLVYTFVFISENRTITLILVLMLLSTMLDITWLFYGLEEFKMLSLRSTFLKVLEVICVITLVRKDGPALLIYALIIGTETLLNSLVLLPLARRYIVFKKPDPNRIRAHIRPLMLLFVPQLAVTVFHNMDKTMLGLMAAYEEGGYYYNANKLINVPATVTTGLSAVFLPRAVTVFADEDKEKRDHFLNRSFEFSAFLSAGMTFGIIGCAKDFIPVFFGLDFMPCILLTYLFAPVLIFKTVSNLYRAEYMIPKHQDSLYIYAAAGAVVVNLILNFLLIPRFGASGAAVATAVAEAVLMLIQFRGYGGDAQAFRWLKANLIYIFFGALMFGFMNLLSRLGIGVIMRIVTEILAGGCFYMLLCLLYWVFFSRDKDVLTLIRHEISKFSGKQQGQG
ncbi:MAG: polysaccharide biosynthesis protein [Erysipelotrichaceae bacterium]|nr:polysaccharide biosynthesis protein [Erysipelotrichaceae bacterium]